VGGGIVQPIDMLARGGSTMQSNEWGNMLDTKTFHRVRNVRRAVAVLALLGGVDSLFVRGLDWIVMSE